jgi:hypothetical protein
MRVLISTLLLCAFATDASAATSVDFETAADGTCGCQEFAEDGFVFSTVAAGTDTVVGCPCFAQQGAPNHAFIGCIGGTECQTGGLADGVLGNQGVDCRFLTDDLDPIGVDGGDVLIEFSVPVSSVSGDLIDVDLSQTFFEAFTITGRDCAGLPVPGATDTVTAPSGSTDLACEPALAPGPGSGVAAPFSVSSGNTDICSILVAHTGSLTRDQVDFALDNIVVDVDLPPHPKQKSVPAVQERSLWIISILILFSGLLLLPRVASH